MLSQKPPALQSVHSAAHMWSNRTRARCRVQQQVYHRSMHLQPQLPHQLRNRCQQQRRKTYNYSRRWSSALRSSPGVMPPRVLRGHLQRVSSSGHDGGSSTAAATGRFPAGQLRAQVQLPGALLVLQCGQYEVCSSYTPMPRLESSAVETEAMLMVLVDATLDWRGEISQLGL